MNLLNQQICRALSPSEVEQIETRKKAAIQAAMQTPGTERRYLRLSIDFSITLAGTPPDDDGLNDPDPVYHARQARLLAAVKAKEALLSLWMKTLVVDQMRQKSWSDWDNIIGGEVALEELLAPALSSLSAEDQDYFAEVPQGASFDDIIDLFSASCQCRRIDEPIEKWLTQ